MGKLLVICSGLLLFSVGAFAAPVKIVRHDTVSTKNADTCPNLTEQDAQELLGDIGRVVAVKCAPVQGLFELTIVRDNRQAVVYMDFSRKYLLPGPIFDIVSKQSVTPQPFELPKVLSKEQFAQLTPEHALLMGNPKGNKKIYVFTDPDCPFCSKLHTQLQKLVEVDSEVSVYIKMFPLEMHPQAYGKSRSILEAASLQVLEQAFANQELPLPQRDESKSQVDDSIKLGRSLGIDGTPALILPNGRVVSGYRDFAGILRLLEEDGAGKP